MFMLKSFFLLADKSAMTTINRALRFTLPINRR
jgi:hypothetical protein